MSVSTSSVRMLPLDQYLAGLNRKCMAAGVLFRDSRGRVLLVEPSYKPNWELPGGAVEAGESPWAAAAREVVEEIGLDRPLGRLLVVDYLRPRAPRPEAVVYVFDGGVLAEPDFSFNDGEVLSAEFLTPAQARERVKPSTAARIEAALEAVQHGGTAMCEQGIRVV